MAVTQWDVPAAAVMMIAARSSMVAWRAIASPTCRRGGCPSWRCHKTRVSPSGMRPTWIPMMSMGTPWPLSQRLDAATRMLGKDRPLLDNHSGTMIPAKASHWARMAAAAAARTTTGHGHGTRGSRGPSASEDSTTNLAEVDVEPDVPMWESCSVRGRRSSGTLPSTGDDSESPHL